MSVFSVLGKPRVLVIAGSDSSGGAGLQADNKVLEVFGCTALNVVTAVTAQDSEGVQFVELASLESLNAQWQASISTGLPQCIKVGMLGSVEIVKWLGSKLGGLRSMCDDQGLQMPKVVLDPVLSATLGGALHDHDSDQRTLIAPYLSLLRHVDVLTPNQNELLNLTQDSSGLDGGFASLDLKQVAEATALKYQLSLLLKGGDVLDGVLGLDRCYSNMAVDYAFVGELPFTMSAPRVDGLGLNGVGLHGTGCSMASAIAASLALGFSEFEAMVLAKAYLIQGFAQAALDAESGPYPAFVHTRFPDDIDSFPDVALLADPGALESSSGFPAISGELGLYPVVDSVEWIERCLEAGVKTIQLRVKDKSESELDDMVAAAAELGRRFEAKLFINDYWELAIKHKAYGVHLGQEDLVDADLKAIESAGLKLGLSNHSWFELARAHTYKPSYIAIGPIYETTTKQMPWKPQGLNNLSTWLKVLQQGQRHYPVVAIGGINQSNAEEVLSTGVGSVAMVRAITEAENYRDAISELSEMIESAS